MALSLFDSTKPEGQFCVLTVCAGNVCRSPLASLLLDQALRDTHAVVTSAGIRALVGEPMTDQNQRIAIEFGLTTAGNHRSRQLTVEMLRSADLVLALAREHRRAAVELLPRVARKTFTLREFGRLAATLSPAELKREFGDGDPAGLMRHTVESVARIRGTIPPPDSPDDEDVIDPYLQSDAFYERSADQIIPALSATALILGGTPISRA